MVFYIILLVIFGGLAFIRLAPSNPAVWHVDPKVTADQDLTGGVRRRVPAGADGFDQLNAIVLATPRTDLLAGSADEGFATYVTRSKWFGFPDYTTVKQDDGVLEIWARLRFGKSDMGVNKARVDGWLDTWRAEQAQDAE